MKNVNLLSQLPGVISISPAYTTEVLIFCHVNHDVWYKAYKKTESQLPQFHSSTLTSTANSKISLLKILDLPERIHEPNHGRVCNKSWWSWIHMRQHTLQTVIKNDSKSYLYHHTCMIQCPVLFGCKCRRNVGCMSINTVKFHLHKWDGLWWSGLDTIEPL